ncbi:MAG: S1/P1 nuclease [Rikenellaceae bacterium]
MRLYSAIITLLLIVAPIYNGMAWGKRGHDVIVHIASRHLSDVINAKIEADLGGRSMVYYASWADNAKYTKEFAYTRSWHYKNVDQREGRSSADNGVVVWAIDYLIKSLQGDDLTVEQRAVDLKILIHIVGDLHQPLHAGRAEDEGGNSVPISFFYNSTSLHAAWDYNMVMSAHEWSYTEWGEQIDRLSQEEIDEILSSNLEDWFDESRELADQIYRDTKPNSRIDYEYLAKYTPIVESQLLKAGIRLAGILKSIY